MTTPAPARPDVAHRVFSAGQLSIGLTLPLLRTGHVVADFDEQLELAALADTLGFRVLWIRDVPLNSADYPDPIGHLDPWVLLGALASRTRRIALASGAIVLPLRHPLHIAKGALSVATLSGGRFVLGLGSGDRPPEYAAFGVDAETRRDRYRAHWDVVAAGSACHRACCPTRRRPMRPTSRCCLAAPTRCRCGADAGGRLGRAKRRLDRASLDRLDDVSPRSGHATRTLFDVARGG